MPIVNSYQAEPSVVADFAQETGRLQALAQQRQRSEAQLAQSKRDAENRAWQEALMDKQAAISNQRDAFRANLQLKSRAIQQAQDAEYQKAMQGLQAPEKARQRAAALEAQRMKLQAQEDQAEEAFHRKLQYQDALDQAKITNYEAMGAVKKKLYDTAINERDAKLAKIEGAKQLTDADKKRFANTVNADFERIWGHVKRPPEEEAVQKKLEAEVTRPDEQGDRYYKNNAGDWKLFPTTSGELRDQRIKAKEAEAKFKVENLKIRAKLLSDYLKTHAVDEGGNSRPVSVDEAQAFVDKLLGPKQKPVDTSRPIDYGTIELILKDPGADPEERRRALTELQQRVQSGDEEAKLLAVKIAQETYGKE